jgi:protein O-mannosyl-transferase
MNDANKSRMTWLICLGLALAVLAAYLPLWHCGFVDYDDRDYILDNDMIKQGLSWPAITWAFTTFHASNWHPLTWLSYLLEYQLFGLNPTLFHATNLLLHLANSILLFLLLQRMTKAQWRSAFVAALFAIHPLHVESVAWIAERKDVLSAFFWLLTIWAYVRYTETTPVSLVSQHRLFYALSLVLFALGLMAKPMLVTLPFVLLLLDYWPLQRLRPPWSRLIWEKIPFFALAALSSWVCLIAQHHGDSVALATDLPMSARMANVPISYVRYIAKTIWPTHLAVLYSIQLHWPPWMVIAASLLLILITLWVIWRRHTQPYLPVGWFWFLGMLVPVIGLVQVGVQAMADRYDYLPGIGLSIMLIWAASEWLRRAAAFVSCPLAGIAIAGCMIATWHQVHYWTDSETLFRHATEVSSGYGVMASNLGRELMSQGRTQEALPYLRQAAELSPHHPETHSELGYAYLAAGQIAEALDQLDTAVRLAPDDTTAQLNFSRVLLQNDLAADALPHLQKVLQLRPEDLQATTDLAWVLACHPDASLRNGTKAVALASHANQITGGQNPVVLAAQAAAYAETGKFPEAITAIQQASHLLGSNTNSPLAASLPAQLALYLSRTPVRTSAPLPNVTSPANP